MVAVLKVWAVLALAWACATVLLFGYFGLWATMDANLLGLSFIIWAAPAVPALILAAAVKWALRDDPAGRVGLDEEIYGGITRAAAHSGKVARLRSR